MQLPLLTNAFINIDLVKVNLFSVKMFFRDNPNDLKTLAQLITAYSQVDPAKANQLSREMPLISDLAADVDVDALELANVAIGGIVSSEADVVILQLIIVYRR